MTLYEKMHSIDAMIVEEAYPLRDHVELCWETQLLGEGELDGSYHPTLDGLLSHERYIEAQACLMLGRPLPKECREKNREGMHYFEKVKKALKLPRKVIARDDVDPKSEVIIGPFAVRLKTQWSQKIGQDALPLHRQGESIVPRSRRHDFCDPERVGCKLGVSCQSST
jgi:hypothetical protein